NYTYNKERKVESISINGTPYCTYEHKGYTYYEDDDGNAEYDFSAVTQKLADGTTFKTSKYGTFDFSLDMVPIVERYDVNGFWILRKEYGPNGLISKVWDGVLQGRTEYTYNNYNLPVEIKAIDTRGNLNLNEAYTYNGFGDVTQKSITGEVNQTYTYTYKNNAARDLDYIGFDGYTFKPLTDCYGRNTGKEIYEGESKVAAEYISYRKVGDHATTMPSTVWFANGTDINESIKYKYDKCGNISEIIENGHTVARYKYDALNRLIREDNKALNKTELFSYDNNGNITERCEYAYMTKTCDELAELNCKHFNYVYDGDRLISYNGEKCAYNAIGNPTTYRGKTVTWKNAKTIESINGQYLTYDGHGRVAYGYMGLFTYDSEGRILSLDYKLAFIYDNTGVVGVKYNGETYFYRKDVQGNIIAILDSIGNVVVKYVYDAWGNHAIVDINGEEITEGIGVLNPFRYRGYFYDTETGLYYLQTRYYDPEIGRFISQDSIDYADPETINGLNLYAYCLNNPIMAVDPTGTKLKWWHKLLIGVAFIVVGAIVTALTAGTGTGFFAAFGSALLSSTIQVGISTAVSAGIGMVVGGISTGTWEGALDGLKDGAVDGFMWGGIFAGTAQIVGGAFRTAANLGVKTGRHGGISFGKTGIKILSPDKNQWKKAGGTLVKFGKQFRLDIGANWGLHMHILNSPHLPIGVILAGIIGGIKNR
ncbi:MAG: RHS repeat-associated core domain-containing protein, partial [Clostridia bacterium]|nr:RHS repeat-associated core domain-containing protein [Clostridia bacterium]